jgi:hypothetical protein
MRQPLTPTPVRVVIKDITAPLFEIRANIVSIKRRSARERFEQAKSAVAMSAIGP